jgi:hypothetical protein
LTVIFGQAFAYSAFSDSHFSTPGSVSGLIASTGHSGSQTPQSMHSSGWMDEHVLALVEAIHGAHVDAVHGFAANAALVDDVGQLSVLSADRSSELIHGVRPSSRCSLFG